MITQEHLEDDIRKMRCQITGALNENARLPKEGFIIKDKFYSPEYMDEKLHKLDMIIRLIEDDLRLDHGKDYLMRDYVQDPGLKN